MQGSWVVELPRLLGKGRVEFCLRILRKGPLTLCGDRWACEERGQITNLTHSPPYPRFLSPLPSF